MQKILPVECEVRFVVPIVRRYLAEKLKTKHDKSQKDIANMLEITEAAVSQYVHNKRGCNIEFSQEQVQILDTALQELLKGVAFYKVQLWICKQPAMIELKCKYHRQIDETIPEDCKLCMEEWSPQTSSDSLDSQA